VPWHVFTILFHKKHFSLQYPILLWRLPYAPGSLLLGAPFLRTKPFAAVALARF
jgi:hypothetical protein